MRKSIALAIGALSAASSAPVLANHSIPSVVVTVENSAPSRGAFQTPFWVAAHDGSFDLYDRDAASSPALERLAEDGATGPLTEAFAAALPTAPQTTLVGPSGPLAPGDTVSFTMNVDPTVDRYFSYASMVIPSNDAFIANGNPTAHLLFNSRGRFVADDFVVAGSEVLDAGTEVNDEIAANTAFLNQGGPDIGDVEGGVVTVHPGFAAPGSLTYPDGVLNHPVTGLADFTGPTYRAASFSFKYVDLAQRQSYSAVLNPAQEVTGPQVPGRGQGDAAAISLDGDRLIFRMRTRNLSGPIVAAHFHNAQAGANGPVVVNLADGLDGDRVRLTVTAAQVVGPLADAADPMLALLNELAAGNIYINVHTAENPAGEIRGQLVMR